MAKKMNIAQALKIVGFVERKEYPSATGGVIPSNARLRALCQGLNALLSEGEAWSAGAIPVAQRLGFNLAVGSAHEALAKEEAAWLETAREARKIVQAAKGSKLPAESDFAGDPIPGMSQRRAMWEVFASLGADPEKIGEANSLMYAFSRRTAGRNDSNRRKAIRVFEMLGIDPLAAGWRLPDEPAPAAPAPAAAPAATAASAAPAAAAAPAAQAPAPAMSAADLAAALRGFMGVTAPAPDPEPEAAPAAPAAAPAPAATAAPAADAAPARVSGWTQEEVDMLAASLRKAGYTADEVVKAFMGR